MSESTQHKIDRIRKPRVHITYDVHIGDAIQKKEIPYVIGILADLSGNPKNPLPIISKRQFINIDKDNINDVLKASNARLNFTVSNKINLSENVLNIELTFKNMKDFEPLSIINQIPTIKEIHTSKINLLDLLAKMENNAILRDITKLLAEDPVFRNQFKDFISLKKKEIINDSYSHETLIEDEASIEQLLKNKIKEIEQNIISNDDSANNTLQEETLADQFSSINNITSNNKTGTSNPPKTSDNSQNNNSIVQNSTSDNNNQKTQKIEDNVIKESDETITKQPTNVNDSKVDK